MSNKLLWSGGSFLACIGLFWFLTGSLVFAGTFLSLLMIHELGHYFAAQQVGMKVTLPVFTPLGAFITMQEEPRDAAQEAYMALGGPFIGTIGAIIALFASVILQNQAIGTAALFGFWLNLFNLIPWSPLDGGRISQVLSRHLWIVGLALLGYFAFTMMSANLMSIVMMVYLVSGGYQDINYRTALAQSRPEYYEISTGLRVAYAALYLGLSAFLFFCVSNFAGALKIVTGLLG